MHKANNFDILRLVFALTVVLAHIAALSQSQSFLWIPHVFNSQIAVEGFFAMSGFLIVGSYERSSTFRRYLTKRALRILPAYWAALLFSLIVGAFMTTLTLRDFLRSADTWKFFFCDLIFSNYLHPTLPGVFTRNPGESAVNGALWTIKLEVMFYLLVPVIVLACRRLGRWQTVAMIFSLSIAYHFALTHLGRPVLAKQLPGQLCFFAGGVLVYYYQDAFRRNKRITWLLVGGLVAAYITFGGLILEALSVSLGTMAAAFLLPHIEGPTKYGDFSYGIYVFHFPLLQALIARGAFAAHPYFGLLETLLAVVTIAIGSWYLVESPSMKLENSAEAKRALGAAPGVANKDKVTASL